MNYELVINHINKQSGFKNQKEMVIKFSEWLDISEASIYNKINGRSRFSVEELLLICQKTNSLTFILLSNVFLIKKKHFYYIL
jgi:hypothetical protein